jgi:hypothetical protein
MKRELAPSIISAVGLLTGAMVTAGCDESRDADDAAEEATDDVTDAAEDVADDVKDAAEDAKDELEDAANEVKPK